MELIQCADCRTYLEREETYSLSHGQVCADCYGNYARCARCRALAHVEGLYIVDETDSWCEQCTDSWAEWCEECDTYHSDGTHRECATAGLLPYHYRPSYTYHSAAADGESPTFFGVELETEWPNGDMGSFVREVNDSGAWIGDLYVKSDGSLDNGAEFVSHPRTLSSWQEWRGYKDLVQRMRAAGARSWDTTTCGIHVHVSRSTFADSAHLARFAHVFYRHSTPMQNLAGRSGSRWASFDANREVTDSVLWWKTKGCKGSPGDRYVAVNMQPSHTVEIRIFRGTLRHSRILADIELVHCAVEYARTNSACTIWKGNWEGFTTYVRSNSGMYPHLCDLLDAKGY